MNTQKKRILMVHPLETFVRLYKTVLEKTGRFEVMGETDPTQAADTALKFEPDLIITDFIMEKVDGVALAKMLRDDSRLFKIPILFFTTFIGKGVTTFAGFPALAMPASLTEFIVAVDANVAPVVD